jgi:hypothetical protein
MLSAATRAAMRSLSASIKPAKVTTPCSTHAGELLAPPRLASQLGEQPGADRFICNRPGVRAARSDREGANQVRAADDPDQLPVFQHRNALDTPAREQKARDVGDQSSGAHRKDLRGHDVVGVHRVSLVAAMLHARDARVKRKMFSFQFCFVDGKRSVERARPIGNLMG